MKNIIEFFNQYGKNCQFISVNGYTNKKGEISNQTIQIGISVENVKIQDLNKLKKVSDSDLSDISSSSKIELETVKIALAEMIEAGEKNLSKNAEERSAQSQAQTDNYVFLNRSLRYHIEKKKLYAFGQCIAKTVLKKGEYKPKNSSAKTLAKDAIKKHLDLRADKIRQFIIPNIEFIRGQGKTITIN